MMTNPDVARSPAEWTTVREWKLDREGAGEHQRRQIYTMTDWQYAGLHFGLFSIYEWPNDFREGKTTDLLEADGQPIAELSGANALVLKNADEIAWRADWKSPEVKRRVGQLVQLRFRLQHATVYGFQLPE